MARQARTLSARLEVDVEVGTLAGTITSEDGIERRFSGWMEFASVIESWRAEHRAAEDGDREPSGPTPDGG